MAKGTEAMPADDSAGSDIEELERRLALLDEQRRHLAARLDGLRCLRSTGEANPRWIASGATEPPVTMRSPAAEKIALFRRLFGGRGGCVPAGDGENTRRDKSGYSPVCRHEWVRGSAGSPRSNAASAQIRPSFCSPTTSSEHTSGSTGRAGRARGADFTAGIYPLRPDETCRFLAADFDKKSWGRDVCVPRHVRGNEGVPAAFERSRSGNGAHVWIFFEEPVPASEARRLGSLLITETMDRCPDIGFDSYDRFFPSQDTMPAGGFGNLIALPLQSGPRRAGTVSSSMTIYALVRTSGPTCQPSAGSVGRRCRLWCERGGVRRPDPWRAAPGR